jgi:hypothetical protein
MDGIGQLGLAAYGFTWAIVYLSMLAACTLTVVALSALLLGRPAPEARSR